MAKCIAVKLVRPRQKDSSRTAFTRHLPSVYRGIHPFTGRLHFLLRPYVRELRRKFLFFADNLVACSQRHIYIRSPSWLLDRLIALRRIPPPKANDKQICLNGKSCASCCWAKRWIPEPESRAFPKTPDQRSRERRAPANLFSTEDSVNLVARSGPGQPLRRMPYRMERMAGSKETCVTGSPLTR